MIERDPYFIDNNRVHMNTLGLSRVVASRILFWIGNIEKRKGSKQGVYESRGYSNQ